jgi:ubiquinone/menaquinone biosynthesis C-methylase UbiE
MARIDYDHAARGYERSRSMPVSALDAWHDALAPHIGACSRLLDLGSGTGVFARALAAWFAMDIVGVEPSEGMRRQAVGHEPNYRIAYVGGDAQHIPLQSSTCDAAWLSTVIHHLSDLGACAQEIRRVMRPHAPVLIRSAFPGRLDDIAIFRWFPTAVRVVDTFPSIEATIEAFALGGFKYDSLQSVPQTSSPSLRAFAARARLRADTTLMLISDEEFEAGLADLDAAAAAENEPMQIVDHLDLLVLR